MKNKMIIIEGTSEDLLDVSIYDILNLIDINEFAWKVFWLEGVGDNILNIEKEINESDQGLFCKDDEIFTFFNKIKDIHEVFIIGGKNKVKVSSLIRNQFDENNQELTIELVDQSYWEIKSNNDELINILLSRLKGAKLNL